MSYQDVYKYVILIQVFDIITNFFTIQVTETKMIDEPYQIAMHYLKSTFIVDVIAVFPYYSINPKLVFIRYLKCIQLRKYQDYLDEPIIGGLQICCSKNKLLPVIKIWDTIVILCLVSHFFACKWILIGYNEFLTNSDGWIY